MKLVVLRGDHRVNEIKLRSALRGDFRPAQPEEIEERLGPPGYIGPAGAQMPILLDQAVDSGPVRRRREQARPPPSRRRARSGLRVRERRRPDGSARRHRQWGPDPDRAGDRGREHLQARPAVLRTAERDVSRRARQGPAHLDGLLRIRTRAGRRCGGRAVRRRAGDLVAAVDGAVRHRGRDARQGRHRRAGRRRPACTPSCRRPGSASSTTTETPERGSKFTDAELLGCPLRVTVGRRTLAQGEVEVQIRRGRESRSVPLEGAADAIAQLWHELPYRPAPRR